MGRRRKPQKQTVKTTADYLAQAVFTDLLPQHPQTCEDYGFNRAITVEEKCNLLGLYTGLIKFTDVLPETIHDWRIRGVLVDEIKAEFYKIPVGSRGAYFPWFLRNQHIVALAGKPLSAKETRDHDDTMLLHVWKFTGGSEKDSLGEIKAAIERKSAEEQKCYRLYALILSGRIPPPSLDLWIDFGFASCTSEGAESALDVNYRELVASCTFREFCDAYRNRRLLGLFHSKGLYIYNDVPQFQDLLSGDLLLGCRKSVWDLKQLVLQEESADEESNMVPSVTIDYGFINCKDASERRLLKKVYKDFFVDHRGDPLALHEAAIKGNLYGFLSNIMHLLGPKYWRLMANHYPLPDKSDAAQASVTTELVYPWVPSVDEPRESRLSPWHVLALLLAVGLVNVLFVLFWFIVVLSVTFSFVTLTVKYFFLLFSFVAFAFKYGFLLLLFVALAVFF